MSFSLILSRFWNDPLNYDKIYFKVKFKVPHYEDKSRPQNRKEPHLFYANFSLFFNILLIKI